jgi:L-ribulose-5-phosphate 3-epimerase
MCRGVGKLRLSIVTDEISQDLEHALQVCRDLNVHTVELRTVDGSNIVFHDTASLQRIRSLLQQGNFQVCDIASPFLKCPFWDVEADRTVQSDEEEQWRILQRSFELARFFDAPMVRTFSFLRVSDPGAVREKVLQVITEAVRRTEAVGLRLALENEHACNIATGEETGWLLQCIPLTAFGVIWDPGNAAALASTPYPDGYNYVRGRIFHVHLKDAGRHLEEGKRRRAWVKIGDGIIDYVGQMRALVRDGYDGTLSLETHYAHPDGGLERATRESLAALLDICREAGVKWQ